MRKPRWVYAAGAASTATLLLASVLVLFPQLGRTHSAAGLVEHIMAVSEAARLPERRDSQMASAPVLSPKLSCSMPSLCSMASSRFDIVVSGAWRRCRPPASAPPAPPASTMGSGL